MEPTTKTCPACGETDLPVLSRFCPACGAAQPAPEPTTPPAQVDVNLEVGELKGGKATGLEVGQLDGDVTVHQRGDTFSVNLGDVGGGSQVAVGKDIRQAGGKPAK
jgi:hypothetical protein